jgi:hypothetical protein
MEPEGSLLCSQGPATGPYPEPLPHCISILGLSSYVPLGLPGGIFSLDLPNKILYFIFRFAIRATCSSHPSFDHPNNIWWTTRIMKLLIM